MKKMMWKAEYTPGICRKNIHRNDSSIIWPFLLLLDVKRRYVFKWLPYEMRLRFLWIVRSLSLFEQKSFYWYTSLNTQEKEKTKTYNMEKLRSVSESLSAWCYLCHVVCICLFHINDLCPYIHTPCVPCFPTIFLCAENSIYIAVVVCVCSMFIWTFCLPACLTVHSCIWRRRYTIKIKKIKIKNI